jgi:hypothetical protein
MIFQTRKEQSFVKKCLLNGEFASRREISGMAQAKLEYVKNLLQICSQFKVKIFATLCVDSVRSTDTGFGALRRQEGGKQD